MKSESEQQVGLGLSSHIALWYELGQVFWSTAGTFTHCWLSVSILRFLGSTVYKPCSWIFLIQLCEFFSSHFAVVDLSWHFWTMQNFLLTLSVQKRVAGNPKGIFAPAAENSGAIAADTIGFGVCASEQAYDRKNVKFEWLINYRITTANKIANLLSPWT